LRRGDFANRFSTGPRYRLSIGETVPQGARTKTEEDGRMFHSSRAKAGKIDLIAAAMLFANAVLIIAVG
jgi:hypothetical protein